MSCDITDAAKWIEYETVLLEIYTLCIQYNAQHRCIVGDMNTDITRWQSQHTQTLKALY